MKRLQLDPLTPFDLHPFTLAESVTFCAEVLSLSIPLILTDGPLPQRGVLTLTSDLHYRINRTCFTDADSYIRSDEHKLCDMM